MATRARAFKVLARRLATIVEASVPGHRVAAKPRPKRRRVVDGRSKEIAAISSKYGKRRKQRSRKREIHVLVRVHSTRTPGVTPKALLVSPTRMLVIGSQG
jgi:hypothetical protein